MATISARSKAGIVAIELMDDEDPGHAAERLKQAVVEAGGPSEPPRLSRQQRRELERRAEERARPRSRDDEMRALGMLECKLCGTWVPASMEAARNHTERCPAKVHEYVRPLKYVVE
jgi:hypothetical protein